MNGYWTSDLKRCSPVEQSNLWNNQFNESTFHEKPKLLGIKGLVGRFAGVSFADLTERCRELNISELELGHIPKSMVREFTSGKCVMVKLASRPGFAMIQISEFLKDPPPHPGYEPPSQPQS
jgi:hypothetical protein